MSANYIESLLTPKIANITELSPTRSRIILEPLERGYGHTLGNSLRRTLLSSIPGSAVTEISITGVQHEFSAIDGVREDVIEIILNLKKLAIKMRDLKEAEAKIQKTGPAIITAADIDLPKGIEIVNDDLIIAHLSDEGKLDMVLKIKQGRGYRPASEEKTASGMDTPIGTLLLDASFSPVKSVVYTVEKARVGQRIDLDKLIIDLEMDGSVDAEEALRHAATILHAQLLAFVNLGQIQEAAQIEAEIEENPIYMESIDILGLTLRALNCLKMEKIQKVGDLIQRTEKSLMDTPNLGAKSLEEIKEALAKHDLCLETVVEGWDTRHGDGVAR